jgi:microcystin-dependent protein
MTQLATMLFCLGSIVSLVLGASLEPVTSVEQLQAKNESDRKLAELERKLSEQGERLVKLETNAPPAGSIVAYGGELPKGEELRAWEKANGWLLCDGRGVATNAYSNLFAAIGFAYTSNALTGEFQLPNFQGMFLRGLDRDEKSDPDAQKRRVGSLQPDAFQGHTHSFEIRALRNPESGSRTAEPLDLYHKNAGGNDPPSALLGGPVEMHDFGPVRAKSETRPVNIAVHYLIKF